MSARLSELQKLEEQYERERVAWRKAHGISSGAGCTPFYADARSESSRTTALYVRLKKKHPRQAKTFRELHPAWTPEEEQPSER